MHFDWHHRMTVIFGLTGGGIASVSPGVSKGRPPQKAAATNTEEEAPGAFEAQANDSARKRPRGSDPSAPRYRCGAESSWRDTLW